MSNDKGWEEWIEYQQNEIDGAKEEISDRMEHLTGRVSHGILEGEFIQENQNERAEAYLEGYGDALEYAVTRVEKIDNLVKYAESATKEGEQ